MQRRVVITGLGTVSPCGQDVASTWESMLAGRSGADAITRFDASDWATRIAAEVSDFDAVGRFGARAAKRLGRFQQFGLAAAEEAMRDAALEGHIAGERLGVYIGTGIGGLPEIVDGALAEAASGPRAVSPWFIPRSLNNLATGQVAIRFGARGPSVCLSTACAVGNHSLGEAWRAILLDEADAILAGGAEAAITPIGLGGFMNMKALSTRNDDPKAASRPFDVGRDGFVMGEGAAVLVLEELSHAEARGARIYAEVIGYAASTDAHHVTAPAPAGEGAQRCMARALQVARVAPEEVGYLNAHGTSTPMNDPTEATATRAVFGDHADRLWVSSTKGVTGHLLGAAGGIEAVATVLALHRRTLPPTANLIEPDPACALRHVRGRPAEVGVDVAISNGFGFGGTNATLVFRRWED